MRGKAAAAAANVPNGIVTIGGFKEGVLRGTELHLTGGVLHTHHHGRVPGHSVSVIAVMDAAAAEGNICEKWSIKVPEPEGSLEG
jgi:hypothetical protein